MDPETAQPPSIYQRLVDRYIDVTSWPTSKKAALVMAIAVPFQLAALGLVARHANALSAIVDAQLVPAWASLHLIVILLLSLFIFLLIQLSLSARMAQQERLRDAHSQLRRANERLERGTRLIQRYVPTQLAAKILAGEHTGGTTPERRKLTLFFSDVVEFTPAADQMEPEDLSALPNEYLAEMAAIADSAGATVNQFVGDGIMIFFGAPDATSDRDHALRAVRMGLAMQKRMLELRERWFAGGIQTPFRIRIGINTGVASVGDFGSEGRTTYSAVGNQTNLTARIQDDCVPGRVLISHTTWHWSRTRSPAKSAVKSRSRACTTRYASTR